MWTLKATWSLVLAGAVLTAACGDSKSSLNPTAPSAVSASALNDEAMVQRVAQLEKASASPGSILALMRANYELDVRHLLPSVRVPTLILHRTGDALVPVAAGRYLAEHIPGARYVEIPGIDHTVLDNETQDVIADEIEVAVGHVPPGMPPKTRHERFQSCAFDSVVRADPREELAARVGEAA